MNAGLDSSFLQVARIRDSRTSPKNPLEANPVGTNGAPTSASVSEQQPSPPLPLNSPRASMRNAAPQVKFPSGFGYSQDHKLKETMLGPAGPVSLSNGFRFTKVFAGVPDDGAGQNASQLRGTPGAASFGKVEFVFSKPGYGAIGEREGMSRPTESAVQANNLLLKVPPAAVTASGGKIAHGDNAAIKKGPDWPPTEPWAPDEEPDTASSVSRGRVLLLSVDAPPLLHLSHHATSVSCVCV